MTDEQDLSALMRESLAGFLAEHGITQLTAEEFQSQRRENFTNLTQQMRTRKDRFDSGERSDVLAQLNSSAKRTLLSMRNVKPSAIFVEILLVDELSATDVPVTCCIMNMYCR